MKLKCLFDQWNAILLMTREWPPVWRTSMTACSSFMYALGVLRSHGLPTNALQEVSWMTTISHLMYAFLVWCGYTSAGEQKRIERLMGRLRCGHCLPPQSPDAAEMAVESTLNTTYSIGSSPPVVGKHPVLGPMASLFRTRTIAILLFSRV